MAGICWRPFLTWLYRFYCCRAGVRQTKTPLPQGSGVHLKLLLRNQNPTAAQLDSSAMHSSRPNFPFTEEKLASRGGGVKRFFSRVGHHLNSPSEKLVKINGHSGFAADSNIRPPVDSGFAARRNIGAPVASFSRKAVRQKKPGYS